MAETVVRPARNPEPGLAELVAAHLSNSAETTPAESIHALDVGALAAEGVMLFVIDGDDGLAAMGGLREMGDGHGEIKSMHVIKPVRGNGLGGQILRRIEKEARARGIGQLWLETGSSPAFAPARALYTSHGYSLCDPFGDYKPDPESVFMTRTLGPES